jgi:uncharacterized protein (TIGR02996 family)
MSDEGFLYDLLENPDNDAVRLIYADWLISSNPRQWGVA